MLYAIPGAGYLGISRYPLARRRDEYSVGRYLVCNLARYGLAISFFHPSKPSRRIVSMFFS